MYASFRPTGLPAVAPFHFWGLPGCHGAGSLKPLSMCCDPIVSHGVKHALTGPI